MRRPGKPGPGCAICRRNLRFSTGRFVMAVDPDIGILVVDDFGTMVRIVQGLLQQVGFTNVEHVGDGATALERLRAKTFSVVISDWRMSPMSGLELLRRMRQDPALQPVRFVLITADANPQLPETTQKLGADGFLMKPFTADALRQTIERAFSHR